MAGNTLELSRGRPAQGASDGKRRTEYRLREKCRVNTNRDADVFVGIVCENGDVSVNFPLGFRVSEEEKELQKDIRLLIRTIGATTARRDSSILRAEQAYDQTAFPIQAYMHVISDYYDRGYYRERDVRHTVAKRGKIDWNRTIKTQKPYVGETGDVFYLDYVTRKNTINEDELITWVHKYCVYESFEKIGWLYTGAMPAKPGIKYKEKIFKRVVRDKLRGTFNDRNRALFRSMLAILEYEGNKDGGRDYRYGTWRFEYVWEALVDRAYGITGKAAYFPRTKWLIGERTYDNSRLEPDAIMLWQGDVYVLDAKYYKYGLTRRPADLPQSASINKQITYGEYVARQEKLRELHDGEFAARPFERPASCALRAGKRDTSVKVYNAFLMPFAAEGEECPAVRIGEAQSEWKSGQNTYERVQGILVDVKHLMKIYTREDEGEISLLAEKIKGES